EPGGLVLGEQQGGAPGQLEGALRGDDPADVGRVLGPAGGDHGLAEGVQLAAQLLDLLVGEVGGGGGLGRGGGLARVEQEGGDDRHGVGPFGAGSGNECWKFRGQASRLTGPAAVDTQVWTRWPGSPWTSPVRV